MTHDRAAQVCADVFRTDDPILQYAGSWDAIAAGDTDPHDHYLMKVLGHTFYRVGDEVIYVDGDITFSAKDNLDTGSADALEAGKDYYVYLDAEGGVHVSLDDTAPAFVSGDTKQIGGFHTICRTVPKGTLKAPTAAFAGKLHELSGWVQGDILPLSVWALNCRPMCDDPSGMVFIRQLGIWVDIYNASGSIDNPQSKFGGTRLNNYTQTQFLTGFANVGKQLLSDTEFWFAALGSNCGTKVVGQKQPNPDTTGGRLDTDGYPMISSIGCEEMCGLQSQWCRDISANSGGSWDLESQPTWTCFDNRNDTSQKNRFGACYAMSGFRALYAGGYWGTGSTAACGPFCRFLYSARVAVIAALGGRGSSCSLGTNKNL